MLRFVAEPNELVEGALSANSVQILQLRATAVRL